MVKRAVNRLSVLFLMLLGVLPQIALLVESADCGVRPRLWLWLVGAALCLWISACFRRGLLLGMPASAALLYAAYRTFDAVPLTELDDLTDRFIGAFYTHYYSPDGQYVYLNAVEDHSFLLLLIAFLLFAYLASALTSRSGRRVMSFLGTIPLFALCLSVNGLSSYTPVLAVLLFWLLVLVSGNYSEDGGSGKTVFLFTLPLLLMLTALLLFSHPEDYSVDERDLSLSRQFDRIGDWIRRRFEDSEDENPFLPGIEWEASDSMLTDSRELLWEADDGSMDMTQKAAPEMLEKLFLRVKAQRSGPLYLRAVSYGDYRGTGWSSAPDAPVCSLGFAASALKRAGVPSTLSVETVSPLRCAVLPYYSASTDRSDARLSAKYQRNTLRYTAYSGEFAGLEESSREELLYRGFAHEVYTRLPEDTKSSMQTIARQAGLDAASPSIVDEVAAYVQTSAVYDLDTEAYPSTDYALWFLTQAHRGFCVHFASAAAVLYRALGIPARVTEGFLVYAVEGQHVEVRGENAHAWVEIYRDGIGWIPVEVTGQSGLQRLPAPTPVQSSPEENQAAPPTAEPLQQSGSGEARLPVGVVQPPSDQREGDGSSGSLPRGTPRLAILLLLLLAAPFLWRVLIRMYWKKRICSKDVNKAAVAIWKRSQRTARFGVSVPAEIQNCAEKACFSAKGADKSDLLPCYPLLEAQAEEAYRKAPFPKKLVLRYLYGLK